MNFTPRQIEAIQSDSPECLTIAGAGSGKTAVLCERVKWLIEQGATSDEILCLTFTTRAAREMKQRLAADLGEDAVRNMMIGTFHAASLRLLQTYGDRISYQIAAGSRLTVAPPLAADIFLRWVCKRLGFLVGDDWKAGLSFKAVRQHLDDYYTGTERTHQDRARVRSLELIRQEYHCQLRTCNCLDFGQILRETQRLLTEHPDVREMYRRRLRHVLVDELQDTDSIQYTLHRFFAPPATFFGVGDARQAIYSWRGARPDMLLSEHPDATVIGLPDCFRCGDEIVKVANTLIAHDPENIAEPMIGRTGRAGAVETLVGFSDAVAERVKTLHGPDCQWSDIAILARLHGSLDAIEDAMRLAGVPYQRIDSRQRGLLGSVDFAWFHAAMCLAVNRNDRVAFMVLAEQLVSGPVSLEALIGEATKNETTLWGRYIANMSDAPVLLRLPFAISALSADSPMKSLDPLAEALFVDAGPGDAIIQFWVDHCADMTIQEGLDWFAALDFEKGEERAADDRAVLATVHGVKGLEWKCVVLADCAEGRLPCKAAIRAGDIAEERRIAYVGMTRPSERLIVHCYPNEEPSRFLAEAGIESCFSTSAGDAAAQAVRAAREFF